MFVTYKSDKDAEKAIQILNNKQLKGRPIIIDYAAEKELYGALKQGLEQLPKPDLNRLRLENKVKRIFKMNRLL